MTDYNSKIFAHMKLAGALVKMLVDSGASCNELSRKPLPRDSVIDRADVKLTTISKARLKVLGETKAQLRNPINQKNHVKLIAIKGDFTLSLVPYLRRRCD